MAAQLCTIGTAAATSADQAITDTPLTVALNAATGKSIPGDAEVSIQAKDASNNYWEVAKLNQNQLGAQITAPGTYRLVKLQSTEAYGAFSA